MTTFRTLASTLALCGSLVLAAPVQAQDSVGVNAAIRNSVQTRNSTSGPLRPAQLRAPVRLGDQFVTGPQSQVQVLLRDRSTFTVGANARMTVDRFVVSENGGSAVSVARGAFRFVSGRTARSSSREAISTPVGSIGVRGTIVEGVVGPDILNILRAQADVPPFTGDEETMLLVVLRGPAGDARTFDTPGAVDIERNGVTVSLERPGQALLVSSDGVFGPFFLPDDISAALGDLLSPTPDPGADSGGAEIEISAAVEADDTAVFADTLPPLDPAEDYEPLPLEDDQRDFPFFPPTQPSP
ncbi:MAG: RTX toxins and related Ca2+-binding protein [bacterium]|nr:MAG: RTX toxins and related Ca2+-binding protein [bacterium]